MERILSFTKENFFLSNFFPQPIEFDGRSYLSSEAAYQSMKVTNNETRNHFSNITPDESKKLGEELRDRADWFDVRIKIMRQVLEAKFRIPEMAVKLLNTGIRMLVEGNTWHDNFWGDCTCDDCISIRGENYLGKLLMNIRTRMIVEVWHQSVEKRACESVLSSSERLMQPRAMDPEEFMEKWEEMKSMINKHEDKMFWGDPEQKYLCLMNRDLYTTMVAEHLEIFNYIQSLRNVMLKVTNTVPQEQIFFVLNMDMSRKIVIDSIPEYTSSFSAKIVNSSEYGNIGNLTTFFDYGGNRAKRREAKFNQKPNKESMVNPHGNRFSKTSYKGRVYS